MKIPRQKSLLAVSLPVLLCTAHPSESLANIHSRSNPLRSATSTTTTTTHIPQEHQQAPVGISMNTTYQMENSDSEDVATHTSEQLPTTVWSLNDTQTATATSTVDFYRAGAPNLSVRRTPAMRFPFTRSSISSSYPNFLSSTNQFLQRPFETLSKGAAQAWSIDHAKLVLVTLLMSVSGMIGAVCYRSFQCFPNMMTGNTIRCLDAVVDFRWLDAAFGGSKVVSYILGGVIYKAMDILLRQRAESKSNKYRPGDEEFFEVPMGTFHLPATLEWVARLSLVVFMASDLVAATTTGMERPWQLPFLALSFGMINAAGNDAFAAVTNAVTGHWTKIALGTTEAMLLDPSHRSTTKALRTSLWGMSAFIGTLILTSGVLTVLEASTVPFLTSIQRALPPLGTSLGLIYAALFSWYAAFYRHKVRASPISSL